MITGAAGFIGFHVAKNLLAKKKKLILVDNLNKYYDQKLKKKRIKELRRIDKNVIFKKQDISNYKKLLQIFSTYKIDKVINLAAQAGVRYSIKKPEVYFKTNLLGFFNILECIKKFKIKKLVYASTSSVYGDTSASPLNENLPANNPIQFYAVTKSSNELMAKAYSKIYNFKAIGLRYFTVYGPWGRPDMALFKFTKAIIEGSTVRINNYGDHSRDFTYIKDIVDGILSVLNKTPQHFKKNDILTPAESSAPWRVLNIGRGEPIHLMEFVKNIEQYFGKELIKDFQPLQPGDVPNTSCDTSSLQSNYEYQPSVSVKEGVKNFLDWYVDFYKIQL